jgi:hypothetical protein
LIATKIKELSLFNQVVHWCLVAKAGHDALEACSLDSSQELSEILVFRRLFPPLLIAGLH